MIKTMGGNMRQGKVSLPASFLIAFCLVMLPCGCGGGEKNRPMGQRIEKKAESKPRLIVLPLKPQEGQVYNGIGLGVHFLLGNVVAPHTGFKEFWFGWRVKKIFPDKKAFQGYCRNADDKLDLVPLSQSQKVRYWLSGNYGDASVRLHFFDGKTPGAVHRPADLAISVDDGLVAFRVQLTQWLSSVGRPMPRDQIQAALWPEKISSKGLDAVGRALEDFYGYSAYGGDGPLDVSPFEKAVALAPGSFMAQDLYGWALYRNRDYKAAREAGRRRYEKVNK